jgi:FAD/FMN-containing dehydrogenase
VTDAQIMEALRAIVGERGLVASPADLENYNVDWRHVFKGQARCAVLPRTTDEVAGVVRLCASQGIGIVPHGGNTGLSGGATPDGSGRQVVLSLARMRAIRDIDVLGETMEVEAGCILQTAQEAAAAAGLMLPISLAAEGSAQIGGVLSTNATGSSGSSAPKVRSASSRRRCCSSRRNPAIALRLCWPCPVPTPRLRCFVRLANRSARR